MGLAHRAGPFSCKPEEGRACCFGGKIGERACQGRPFRAQGPCGPARILGPFPSFIFLKKLHMILYLIYDFFLLFLYMLEGQLIFFLFSQMMEEIVHMMVKKNCKNLIFLLVERSQFIAKHNQMSLMTVMMKVMMMCTLRLLVECYYLMFIQIYI